MLHRLFKIGIIVLTFGLMTVLSAQSDSDIFTESADLLDQYRDGLLLNYAGLASIQPDLSRILRTLESGEGLTTENRLGYHCLGYNLKVITSILDRYPLQSVNQIPQFFEQEVTIDGELYTLQSLEQMLVSEYQHGAIHFLLIKGTKSSPSLPIHDLIRSDKASLDSVLKAVLNNREFTYVYQPTQLINLSSIFDWYSDDFGGIDRVVALIENSNIISLDGYAVEFDKYDWTLNDIKNGVRTRYYPTRLLTKSEVEFQLFENYYTQVDPNQSFGFDLRSSFFNQNISLLFGSNRNINWGVFLRMRSVNVTLNRSIGTYFSGIQFFNDQKFVTNGIETYRRFGITAFGPQVKYRPTFNLRGNSLIIHTLSLPIGKALEGNSTLGFLDWAGYTLTNKWLYDRDLDSKRNILFDIGFNVENIDRRIFAKQGGYVVLSTPAMIVYHYFPAPKWTLYGLAQIVPRLALQNYGTVQSDFVPLGQVGGGIKRFVSDLVELELLITQFFGGTIRRNAQTVNIGMRYNY